MNLSDKIVATIRTAVPALVGMVLAWLIANIPAVAEALACVDENLATVTGGIPVAQLLGALATTAVIAGYYWAARKLGAKWPGVEKWLLGSSKTPVYNPVAVTYLNGDVSVMTREQYRAYLQSLADDADAARNG